MIRNEQQYRISKAQALNFAQALNELENRGSKNGDVHSILRKAEQDALMYQQNELQRQIAEYERLKSGKLKVLEIESFDELPIGLIRARIAKGLSQKELAEKLGMKEQQIQRYEATNYGTASFERIKEVVDALGVKIKKEIFISDGLFSKNTFFKNLKSIGLDSEIILKRFLPYELALKIENLDEYVEDEARNYLFQAGASVGKILGLEPKSFFESKSTLELNLSALQTARFKKSATSSIERISAYTIYAHTLALLILEATKDIRTKKIPTALEIRKNVLKKYSVLNLKNLLQYIWDLGVPVLPLRDPGSFHGACWRVEGRNVIVLKQRAMSEARWIYDLSHEVCHAGQHPNEQSLEIIESNQEAKDWIETEDEKEANYFAAELVLGESADDLAEEAILSAKKDLVKLKKSVQRIAEREKIDSGALANYIAYRLQAEQKISWWSTAHNLQNVVSDPFEIAKEVLLERMQLEQLNEVDKELVIRTLV
jgi:Zn-dependent peptidase ImmA (M78 family)/DNA-binding Xre family transcriptional regulator